MMISYNAMKTAKYSPHMKNELFEDFFLIGYEMAISAIKNCAFKLSIVTY